MIVSVPHPVLTTPAKNVGKIDRKILDIIAQMKKTLLEKTNPKGVGLAAPQIGIPLKIFITKSTEESGIEVFINPTIMEFSKEKSEIKRPRGNKTKGTVREKKLEGCLSIPNVWGYLKRSSKVILRYTDIKGIIREKGYSGFMATIIQHETDHLEGILFTRRVLEQKQKLYRIERDEKGEETLTEIEL